MKTTFFIFSLFAATLLLTSTDMTAQAQTENQTFYVHEDQVKFPMLKEYEATTKDFVAALKEHDIKDAGFMTASLGDGTYLSLMPINNMADLDKNPLAPLAEKMGEEKFRELFTRFNKCYDNHRDYLVHLIGDLSYMPAGLSTTTPGENFRKYHLFYVTPENAANLSNKIAEIKNLYVKKDAKENFRVYRSGFGSPEEFYMVVISAKNAESYAKTSDETEKLLGPEGNKLMDEMMQFILKYETREGRMRPDLAYTSN